jgi:acyl dehydratase
VTPLASASFEKTVSEADVALYLTVSGDELPSYLVAMPDGNRVAPSPLLLGYVPVALARLNQSPGRTIFVTHYRVVFPEPILVGDSVTTSVTVINSNEPSPERLVEVSTVTDDGRVVAQGQAWYRLV